MIEKDQSALEGRRQACGEQEAVCALGMPGPCEHVRDGCVQADTLLVQVSQAQGQPETVSAVWRQTAVVCMM